MDYKNAGVDIEAGYKSVELMKKYVQGTMRPEVLTNLGGFSGAFSIDAFKNMEKPTLVSGTDGVGTKLKLAFIMDKHDTIGIDCVAMCVNDIACAGGEPLFFLDYIACGKNIPEKIADIVSGVAEGCKQSSAALIGGETAEHPGLMPEDEYDLAGFAVGVVDEKDIITGKELKAGDVLIGMASSGVHSNGFSLVRKIFDIDANPDVLHTKPEELGGKTLGMIGCGRISQLAMKKCKYGFGMKVIGYDPYMTQEKIGDLCELKETAKEVWEQADFVSVHLPVVPSTEHSIGREQFSWMKPTASFINCARGALIKENELVECLQDGTLFQAGLDVFEHEPIQESSRALFDLDNVIMTPHMAATTEQSVLNCCTSVANDIVAVCNGQEPQVKAQKPKF